MPETECEGTERQTSHDSSNGHTLVLNMTIPREQPRTADEHQAPEQEHGVGKKGHSTGGAEGSRMPWNPNPTPLPAVESGEPGQEPQHEDTAADECRHATKERGHSAERGLQRFRVRPNEQAEDGEEGKRDHESNGEVSKGLDRS